MREKEIKLRVENARLRARNDNFFEAASSAVRLIAEDLKDESNCACGAEPGEGNPEVVCRLHEALETLSAVTRRHRAPKPEDKPLIQVLAEAAAGGIITQARAIELLREARA